MNDLFTVSQEATWYRFEDYEFFRGPDGYDRIRPISGCGFRRYDIYGSEKDNTKGSPD